MNKELEGLQNSIAEADGKCPESGCIQKQGDGWVVISNKTGKPWSSKDGKPIKHKTKELANKALAAYHVHQHQKGVE